MVDLLMETELRRSAGICRHHSCSADALVTVINDILDFTKMESGKMELEEYPFELSPVFRKFGLFCRSRQKRIWNSIISWRISP